MTNDEIKADIIEACEDFQAAGYQLVSGVFAPEKDEPCGGCALAAVAFVHGGIIPKKGAGDRIARFARKRYGWNKEDGDAFVEGFDAIIGLNQNHTLYDLGRAVCDEVHPAERI